MLRKRFLALALILLLLLPILPGVSVAQTAPPSPWAVTEIDDAYFYGLIDDTFLGDYQSAITREEFSSLAVYMYEALSGSAAVPSTANPFTDTDSPVILKAYSLGIVKGVGDGKFAPTRAVTREEIATMYYRTVQAALPILNMVPAGGGQSFADSSTVSPWAADAVVLLSEWQVIKGKANNLFAPKDNCKREEAIALTKRAYEYAARQAGLGSQGMFYKVSGGTSTVYLLGSIHRGVRDFFPLSGRMMESFSSADYLVLESSLDTSEDDTNYIRNLMFFQDGNRLSNVISWQTYDLLMMYLQHNDYNVVTFNYMKPWAVYLLLSNLQAEDSGLKAEYGIDHFFEARKGPKPILELEGARAQIQMFEDFYPYVQELMLQSTLLSLMGEEEEEGSPDDGLDEMMKAWQEGDANAFSQYVYHMRNDTATFGNYNHVLWDSRDQKMAEVIRGYLSNPEGKTYFVVVGAGHLFTDKGIIAQLRNSGYTVEQVK